MQLEGNKVGHLKPIKRLTVTPTAMWVHDSNIGHALPILLTMACSYIVYCLSHAPLNTPLPHAPPPPRYTLSLISTTIDSLLTELTSLKNQFNYVKVNIC